MKALVLGCALSILGAQAHADQWPKHGFFWAQDGVGRGGRYCDLRAELRVSGAIFALVIRENPFGSLMLQFMTQVRGVNKAKQVVVSIDNKEVYRFVPQVRNTSLELPAVAAMVNSAQGVVIIDQLREAAKGARWLQVEALPYRKAIPANGLKQAMDDLVACRTARSI